VLAGYGTGAVMAVPGHDERDYKFAKHFNLPILEVVAGGDLSKEAYAAKDGILINSDFLNGLTVKDAIKKAIEKIESQKLGQGKINFRLRDAVFGRQRYWGEPIPVYYKNEIPYAVEESELPLVLPEVDKFLPTEDGEPPLARASSTWKKEGKYEYEYSTMPGWAGSSWYFFRYMDPNNGSVFAGKELMDYWQSVDLYIGGSEHATGHLLYFRFWTKLLFDLGLTGIEEPVKKLINQGMIQGISTMAFISTVNGKKIITEVKSPGSGGYEIHVPVDFIVYENGKTYLTREKFEELKKSDNRFEGVEFVENTTESKIVLKEVVEKMSKSKYNVVTPDLVCEKFGADTLRLYEMFLGPLEQSKPWNTNGITGVSGFLKKLWRLFNQGSEQIQVSDAEPTKAELKTLHKTIKKISEDIERFSFNTSVSNFMICVNELTEAKCNKRAILEPLLICLSPYAPHITEELWHLIGHNSSIAFEKFPEANESYLVDDAFMYPISFNGKTRFNFELPAGLSPTEIEKEVMSREEVQKYLDGKMPKKIIVVPKKIVNIVV